MFFVTAEKSIPILSNYAHKVQLVIKYVIYVIYDNENDSDIKNIKDLDANVK